MTVEDDDGATGDDKNDGRWASSSFHVDRHHDALGRSFGGSMGIAGQAQKRREPASTISSTARGPIGGHGFASGSAFR